MKNFSKNLFFFIFTLILVSLFISFFFQPAKPSQPITLNELASKINTAEVERIIVQGNNLEIELKDGKKFLAVKEPEVGLSETLRNLGVTPLALRQVSFEIKEPTGIRVWFFALIPILLPFLIIILFFWFIFKRTRKGMEQVFTFGQANVKLFNPFKEKVTFDDVANLEETKEELKEIVDFLKNPKKYIEMGAKVPRGVLLVGAPGTGKTMLARAVATEAKVPFFYISASEFVEMFIGVGASRVRSLFSVAKKNQPSIIFIDELDAIGRQRGAGLGGGHDEREQTLNQILVEMDGFERETKVIILSASNRPDVLDPALLRPGRFDRRIVLDLPDIKARQEILKIHGRDKTFKNVDLKKIAIRTPGFSGADLANIMNEAAILAARQNKKFIEQQDLYEAVEKVILGPERKSKVISQKEKEITAYHEAGHALTAASIKEADPIQKVSIISRGLIGGYTMKLPIEEIRLKTKKQFLADLVILFGGYAAEKAIFNDISTGAASDLKEATNLAKRLVTRYGMSQKLTPRTFGKTEELIFLGREITSGRDYSEEIAAKIDREINQFIEQALAKAGKIISSYKKVLTALAQVLLEKETLEHEEFYQIISQFKVKPR